MRLLIVEDDPQIQRCLHLLLEPQHEIVGTFANGSEALGEVSHLHPDILLLDISVPGMDGFQMAQALRAAGNSTYIIFVSNHRDDAYLDQAFSIGAQGYVYKPRAQTELLPAIDDVSRGASYVSSVFRQ
jgi:DNA-binding NarL/FixJ family response regulator